MRRWWYWEVATVACFGAAVVMSLVGAPWWPALLPLVVAAVLAREA